MKQLLTIALLAMANSLGFSQEIRWGVKGGLNFANLRGDATITYYDTKGNKESTDGIHKGKLGFHIGGFLEYPINEKLSLQPELLISLQGTKFENTTFYEEYYGSVLRDVTTSTLTNKVNLTYLAIPIMLKYNIIDKLNVEIGPQIGLLIGAKNSFVVTNATVSKYTERSRTETFSWSVKGTKNENITINKDPRTYNKISSFDLGLNFGASYDITCYKKLKYIGFREVDCQKIAEKLNLLMKQ